MRCECNIQSALFLGRPNSGGNKSECAQKVRPSHICERKRLRFEGRLIPLFNYAPAVFVGKKGPADAEKISPPDGNPRKSCERERAYANG